MAEICAAAGVSPGHLYHYFPSKESIIDAMADSDLATTNRIFSEMAQETDALKALLAGLGARHQQKRRRQPKLAIEIVAEAGRNDAIAKIVRHHGRTVRSLLAKHIQRGQQRGQIDSTVVASHAAALLIGMSQGMKCLAVSDPTWAKRHGTRMMRIFIQRLLHPKQVRRS